MTYAWFDVTRNAGIARIMHVSYCSKTYEWNDIILVKRSMIRVFFYNAYFTEIIASECFVELNEFCSTSRPSVVHLE